IQTSPRDDHVSSRCAVLANARSLTERQSGKSRGGCMATTVAIGTMKVVQVSSPGADFKIVEREIPEPGAGHVRIKVRACGVCHSDVLTKEGAWPGIQYPRVPGHEVAGIIDEMGDGVSGWETGQRA